MQGEGAIDQKGVETLMKRGLKPVGDKFTWTADLRLRIPLAFNHSIEQVENYARSIKCPMLVVKASTSNYLMDNEYAKRLLRVYTKSNPHFEFHKVEGGHSLHLTNPEPVADIVNSFLHKTDFTTKEKTDLSTQESFPDCIFEK